MTYDKSIIQGINYLISPEDTTVEINEAKNTVNYSGFQAVILGTLKTLFWSGIAVFLPIILL